MSRTPHDIPTPKAPDDNSAEEEIVGSGVVAHRTGVLGLLARIVLPLGLLALGIYGYSVLSIESEEAKIPEPEAREIRTRVADVRIEDYPITVVTQGTVRPSHEVSLNAEVGGRIIRISPTFEDGAFFEEGDVLVELDASDFEVSVTASQAQLVRAQAALAQEEARAKQARLNWQDLGYTEEPNELVLRLPQLREAQANVDAAAAELERTQRNLQRTKIRAPFDGRVRQRSVGLGQSVGTGTPLGTVFAVDYAEVRLPVSGRDMAHLDLPEGPKDPPIKVELSDALNPENEMVWNARIMRTEGVLDENSLELFAIARVDDPFGKRSGLPPLRIGQPVVGSIAGRVLRNVVVLPRAAVQQWNQVYLVDKQDHTLLSHSVDPLWSTQDHVIIRDELIDTRWMLATTPLVNAPDGATVQIMGGFHSSGATLAEQPGSNGDLAAKPEKSKKSAQQ